jgi:alpha-D-ribose 1-methylphosphonate 5-triphosphate synthase subunit PhnG
LFDRWAREVDVSEEIKNPDHSPESERKSWMAVLARARQNELDEIVARLGGLPDHVVLKPAETGTVMVEARAGGTGRRFNLGEATMTRCVVRLADGTMGFAYALGTDRRKALMSAVIDGLLQSAPSAALRKEIDALGHRQAEARQLSLRKAAATKVDFFTLVRGHD